MQLFQLTANSDPAFDAGKLTVYRVLELTYATRSRTTKYSSCMMVSKVADAYPIRPGIERCITPRYTIEVAPVEL